MLPETLSVSEACPVALNGCGGGDRRRLRRFLQPGAAWGGAGHDMDRAPTTQAPRPPTRHSCVGGAGGLLGDDDLGALEDAGVLLLLLGAGLRSASPWSARPARKARATARVARWSNAPKLLAKHERTLRAHAALAQGPMLCAHAKLWARNCGRATAPSLNIMAVPCDGHMRADAWNREFA